MKKIELSSLKDALCKIVEIDPVVLEKKIKMWKVYDENDAQRTTTFNLKSSLEPTAQVKKKPCLFDIRCTSNGNTDKAK